MVNRRIISASLFFLLITVICSLAYAGNGETSAKQEINENDILKEAINKDKELYNKLMQQNQPPREPDPAIKDVEFEIGDNQVMGKASTRLIMVQFSDYSCSHCAFFTKVILPDIEKNYIDTGKLRYVVIDYPILGNLSATSAAEAAHCASDQGKFWEMHEEIMFDQAKIEDINGIASSINLDMTDFKVCMEIKKYADVVIKNVTLADKLGIPTVPGFILGVIDPGNPEKVKGISFIRGAKPYEIFKEEIEKVLADHAK
jgi:protein-disulfide isomerase